MFPCCVACVRRTRADGCRSWLIRLLPRSCISFNDTKSTKGCSAGDGVRIGWYRWWWWWCCGSKSTNVDVDKLVGGDSEKVFAGYCVGVREGRDGQGR
jgi:hypothetical protein